MIDEIAKRFPAFHRRLVFRPFLRVGGDHVRPDHFPAGHANDVLGLDIGRRAAAAPHHGEPVIRSGLPKPVGPGLGKILEPPLARPQGLLGTVAFTDVENGGENSRLAIPINYCRPGDQPAVLAILAHHPDIDFEWRRFAAQPRPPVIPQAFTVAGMGKTIDGSLRQQFFRRVIAENIGNRLVREMHRIVAMDEHTLVGLFDQAAKPRLAFAQFPLGAFGLRIIGERRYQAAIGQPRVGHQQPGSVRRQQFIGLPRGGAFPYSLLDPRLVTSRGGGECFPIG